jgi:hypothetical protein
MQTVFHLPTNNAESKLSKLSKLSDLSNSLPILIPRTLNTMDNSRL